METKTSEAVRYILGKREDGVTRSEVVKLLYLVDEKLYQEQKDGLNKLVWVNELFGPHAVEIYGAIANDISIDMEDDGRYEVLLTTEKGFVPLLLSDKEREQLNIVIEETKDLGYSGVMKIVMVKEEVKTTQIGEVIELKKKVSVQKRNKGRQKKK